LCFEEHALSSFLSPIPPPPPLVYSATYDYRAIFRSVARPTGRPDGRASDFFARRHDRPPAARTFLETRFAEASITRAAVGMVLDVVMFADRFARRVLAAC